jgi:excisionase family DNA binding protein
MNGKPEDNNVEKLLTPKEAAKILGVSLTTMRGIIASGDLRYARLGKRIMIDPADLEKYVEDRKTGGKTTGA